MIGEALVELADIANCVSGDFHTMHLNFSGEEFDTMHKKVLQKYYEQAAEDYDAWAEAAAIFDATAPSTNESATRIGWKSVSGMFNKTTAVERTSTMLEAYLEMLAVVFKALSKDDYKSIGVQNAVQGRIEYWSKELCYFNKRRKA